MVKSKKGEMLQSSILKRTETGKLWDYSDGKYNNLSYDKMISTINHLHPRIFKDDKVMKVPLCASTGSLAADQQLSAMDDFGVGVSLYFKLLKSLVSVFAFCSVLSLPIYYIYSCGAVS